ncbi:POLYPHENOL OXIDASE C CHLOROPLASTIC-LIKE [Salix purpurea]|uniref:POLYPHENOL OXIDASE C CHLOROPLASTIC-LIKE n=1 Tax=Salix purpurea TaxID=77065 RepID=A0A9Q1ADK8_SALPP|nr:POLYPHENOL OXIDASE C CHLOROPLASTIC-LIKE [Salix purpurea]
MAHIYRLSSLALTPSSFRTSSRKVSSHSIPRSVSSKATNDPQNPTTRRDVIFGLGGLYYGSSVLSDAKAVSSLDKTRRGTRDFDRGKVAQAAETKNMALTPISAFPLDLDKVISTEVSRPKKARSKKEKQDEEEVLVIEGVGFERGESRTERKSRLTLAINELLDNLEAEGDDSLVVTLVPRSGKSPVSIGGVKIEYTKD